VNNPTQARNLFAASGVQIHIGSPYCLPAGGSPSAPLRYGRSAPPKVCPVVRRLWVRAGIRSI